MLFRSIPVKMAKIAILGFTFKENCPDTRNTKIIDIVNELKEYGITPVIADPTADANEAKHLYGIDFCSISDIHDCNVIILAVAHNAFASLDMKALDSMFVKSSNNKKVIADLKGILDRKKYETAGYCYWRL